MTAPLPVKLEVKEETKTTESVSNNSNIENISNISTELETKSDIPSINENTQIKSSLFKQNYICCFRGPILFTAPHSVTVLRHYSSDELEYHTGERHTPTIATKLAELVEKILNIPTSFIIWNLFKGALPENSDPNFVRSKQFNSNKWHKLLHIFKQNYGSKPLLHIDIHGKKNAFNNLNLDVGMKPMIVHWTETKNETKNLVNQIKDYFDKEFRNYQNTIKIYNPKGKRNMEMDVNTQPALHGWWYGDLFTMSEQSILLGIPSVQFEIPYSIRIKLDNEYNFIFNWAKLICNLYNNIICKNYNLIQNIPYFKGNNNEFNHCKFVCKYTEFKNKNNKNENGNENKIEFEDTTNVYLTNNQIKQLTVLLKNCDWKKCLKKHLKSLVLQQKFAKD